MKTPQICHIIVAAGSGSRFGAKMPKQYMPLLGRPVLMTTIQRMRALGRGGHIIVVLHSDWVEPWLQMCADHSFESPEIVIGGATRWESVRNAITRLPADTEIVTIHDGARPIVTAEVVNGVLDAIADGEKGAIPAIAVTDSLRHVNADGTNTAVDRSAYMAVQTPQAFPADIITEAYTRPYRSEFTDDASVVESAHPGIHIALTPGSASNIKITHPHDLQQAERLLADLDK